MTFLTALTGLSLVLGVAVASGALFYLLLACLNRLEVATVAPAARPYQPRHVAGSRR